MSDREVLRTTFGQAAASYHQARQDYPPRTLDLGAEIRRRLAARPDGLLRRHWGAVVHVARRRS